MMGHGLGSLGNYVLNERDAKGSFCEDHGRPKDPFLAEFLGFDEERNGFARVDGFGSRHEHNKRMRLIFPNEQAAPTPNEWDESRPLGLSLTKTPSFVNLIETKLSQEAKGAPFRGAQNIFSELKTHPVKLMQNDVSEGENSSSYDFAAQPMSEKLKASNFPAILLRIGSWERVSRHEGDLVAKCYYAKRKLVWEILDSGLKSKIEIQWSDISAIRATTHENGPGILEVELSHPPLFFRETNPQPRKHTLWQATIDFTGGQAPLCRRHYLQFPEGALARHYDKLLQCDNRLYVLSQRPFPSLGSPYFSNNGGYEGYFCDLDSCRLTDPGFGHAFEEGILPLPPHHDTVRPTAVPSWQFPRLDSLRIDCPDLTSPCSVIDFPQERGARQQMEQQKSVFWQEEFNNQEKIVIRNGNPIVGLPMSTFPNQITPYLPQQVDDGEALLNSNNWVLQKMAEDLLNDQADEQRVQAEANPPHLLLDYTLQLDSAVENIDDSYEQYYDEEGAMNNPTVHLPVQDSDEYILRHLPLATSYQYVVAVDQSQEDFGYNDPNTPWY